MQARTAEGKTTHRILGTTLGTTGTKIPVAHSVPVLQNQEQFGRERKKEKKDVFTSTPKSWKNTGTKKIAGRMLMPPMAQKNVTFSTTQIINYSFSTVGLVKPANMTVIPICPFSFSGSDQPVHSAVKYAMKKSPLVQQKTFGNGKSVPVDAISKITKKGKNVQDQQGQTITKKSSELRSQRHQQMFKSRYAKTKRDDALNGFRLNRRFDLLMKFREDAMAMDRMI